VVGWGEAWRVDTRGADRFAEAEAAWRRLVAAARVDDPVRERGSGLVAFGSFAFADDSSAGGSLVVPAIVVGRRGGRSWLTEISALPSSGSRPAPAALQVTAPVQMPADVVFSDGALPGPAWQAMVAATVRRIAAAEADKVVLARDLVAAAVAPVDDRALLLRLAERYPSTWTFAVDGLVGATPELLARTEGGLVASRVLAGTIRRSGDDVADLALAASLARSGKDLAEHLYAVRSVVEALHPLCSGMNVPDSPYVLHLANVMHLATDVTGVLAGPATSLGIAAALHPSAAVCGTPTKVAQEIIGRSEHMDRGRYAGPVGWLGASGDGEWGIALRCGQLSPSRTEVRLFAGCGIVADSDPVAELAESAAKFVPMRDALTA
jgi:menaquinone-specific isochorismate synthase